MKIKNIVILIVLMLKLFTLHAHIHSDSDSTKQSFKDRLRFFMGAGGQIGGPYSNFSLHPQVGYQITPKLTTGIGANWQYFPYLTSYSNIYGANAFARYLIRPSVFSQLEFQELNYINQWQQYAMLGLGTIQNRGVYIAAYYLLLYPSNNLYKAPYFIRFGISF
jgi:hypothetical protein